MKSNLRKRAYIREWREQARLTQAVLAEKIGKTEATLSRIETGKIAYTQPTIEAVAAALGIQEFALLLPPNDVRRIQEAIERMSQIVREAPSSFRAPPANE